ncbi:cyclophilin-like fold protein [Micromonospora sp. NPDC093277]|uniref:cyclophilin-like fold protein n=1 Tax=Micromonospora sp. NPDC093277 TaxID=3364291 RepID=UPI0038191A6F
MDATQVRFVTDGTEIGVRIADNPTSRDFISKLPLRLRFEEFAGKEKISYLPERLTTDGSPGSAPQNGNLIYYVPWGNLGFFYNADGGHDDNVITIGRVESGVEQLDRLERGEVTVEVVE